MRRAEDHPFFSDLRPTVPIAHRGGAALAPENTLVAFEQAVRRWGARMLEIDVRRSADGELVVFHDAEVSRCTDGQGRVEDLDLATLRRLDAGFRFSADGGRTHPFRGRGVRIPTLREVLRAFPDLRLNVELKADPGGAAEAFAALLREEGALARVCIGSEEDGSAARLAELVPEACHFYPRQALTEAVLALRRGDPPPADDRYLVLDMPLHFGGIRLIDPPFLAAARAAGRWVNVWTVDDEEEMRRLVREGVGGIMTDRPDRLCRVLASGRA